MHAILCQFTTIAIIMLDQIDRSFFGAVYFSKAPPNEINLCFLSNKIINVTLL